MEAEERPVENMPVCEWCRMGLHRKCDRKESPFAQCTCDCERGW